VGKASPIAQANRYGHGSRDSRHKWHVVRQFQQIGNRHGKQRLVICGYPPIPTVDHLFAPIARASIFVKEHGGTPIVLHLVSPGRRSLRAAAPERQDFAGEGGPIFPCLMNATLQR